MKSIFGWIRSNGSFLLWVAVLVPSSVYWCRFLGLGDSMKMRIVLALISGCFAIGCVFGFLFTSYGEEQSTIGKIRDWLMGGITGLGIAEAIEQGGTLKKILVKFQFSQSDNDFALVIGTAIAYVTVGFFFMFFQRELILNVSLASKRAERGRIDGTHQAGLIIQRTLSVLPASVLTGIEDIEEVSDLAPEQAQHLRDMFYSSEVEGFLSQADTALRDGFSMDWDVVSKVAYIHYYRTYLESKDKAAQIKRAEEWLLRAVTMNPLHVDLTMKYADVLMIDKRFDESAAILDRIRIRIEAPLVVRQWLGYVLLFTPHRISEAVENSEWFHQQFPEDATSLFNAACGYAQLYCAELSSNKTSAPNSTNRRNALMRLRSALNLDPSYVNTVSTKWTERGQDFECLKIDPEFLALIGEFKQVQTSQPEPAKPSVNPE
jgi:hypothetical protein